jgi:AcrR family transcriptional regulator
MGELTESQAMSRGAILEAAEAILADEGMPGLNVSAIMRRAGISRTAFYRRFDDVYGVVAAVLDRITEELVVASGDWLGGGIGSPGVIHGNLLSFARAFELRGRTLDAIRVAALMDDGIGALWSGLVQAFRDATEAAILRDQAAGVIDGALDAAGAAVALTWMGEQASFDLMGRRASGGPEAYADLLTPVWTRTLFGIERESAATT